MIFVMPESPRISRLRETLEAHDAVAGAQIARRKQLAEEALADVLGAISHGFWSFDGWTAHFLAAAVAAAQEGRYDEARANVAVALRSLEDRGPGHTVPAERQRTLEELKRELAILRTQPAR